MRKELLSIGFGGFAELIDIEKISIIGSVTELSQENTSFIPVVVDGVKIKLRFMSRQEALDSRVALVDLFKTKELIVGEQWV